MAGKKWLFVTLAAAALFAGFFAYSHLRPDNETLLGRARAAFNKEKFPAARELFGRIVRNAPRHSGVRNEAALFYAVTFLREKNYRRAEAEFKKFLAEYPTSFWSPEAYFNLAECATNLGHPAEGRRLYNEIVRRFPTTSWAEYSKDHLKK